MIKVVVVDDQPLLRAGFAMIFKSEPDLQLVAEAGNGLEAIAQCKNHRPDVVLMDIRMPEMDGLEATKEILQLADAPAIIILTTFDLDEYVYDALRAGASGFLLKDSPADELINAIRIIADGQALLAPSVTKRMIDQFASQSPSSPSASQMAGLNELTERETEVLQLMAKGMSNSEIAKELSLGGTTIKTHVSRILSKVGARDRVQAVITAFEAGIVPPRR